MSVVFVPFFNLSLKFSNNDLSHNQLLILFLITVQRFSIFGCKEYNKSDFGIDNLMIPCIELSLLLLEESVCYDQCALVAKLCQPLSCFFLYSKAKLACYSRYFLTFSFAVQFLIMKKKTSFLVLNLVGLAGHHRTIQLILMYHLIFPKTLFNKYQFNP